MEDKSIQFITDKNGRKTHAIIPIDVYKDLLSIKSILKHTATLGTNELYTLTIKNVTATGYPSGTRSKPDFIVLRNSQAVLMETDSVPPHIQAKREEFLGDGTLALDPENNCFIFTKDVRFQSPSSAAAIVSGNVRNGLDVWINREGVSLNRSGFGLKK